MTLNIRKLYEQGQENLAKKHDEEEKEKIGILRAGNAGVLDYDKFGDPIVAGKCHRMSFLRFIGIKPKEQKKTKYHNQRLMFEAGFTNEDSWKVNLEAAGLTVKCEEEVPVRWNTSNNTEVSGSPDIIILD